MALRRLRRQGCRDLGVDGTVPLCATEVLQPILPKPNQRPGRLNGPMGARQTLTTRRRSSVDRHIARRERDIEIYIYKKY